MSIGHTIAEWLFPAVVHRERQRARAYAGLAVVLRRRCVAAGDPVPAVTVEEAARLIVDEDARVGIENYQTEIAEKILEELKP